MKYTPHPMEEHTQKKFGQTLKKFKALFSIITNENKRKEYLPMDTKEKLSEAKRRGISIKMVALNTDIKPSTLYAFNCGKINLVKEKEDKVIAFLDKVLNL
jgi:hypothetical protein